MPSAYAKHLMPTLAQRLDEFLGGPQRAKQLELYEELALARTLLTQQIDTLTVLELAQSRGEVIEVPHLVAARQMVKDGLNLVADLASKQAKIEKDLTDKVGVQALGMFVEDITRMIHKRLGGDTEVAMQLTEDLMQLKLPGPGVDPGVRIVEVDLE